jgi:hypothetical protein
MKINVQSAKEKRKLELVKELYDNRVSIEYIFGRYFEWDAINSHLMDEDEAKRDKGVLTVGDATLIGKLKKKMKGKVF